MKVGLVGKPNAGKSTFFSAATLAPAQIGDYPFTTIDANKGISHVTSPCACKSFNIECNNCEAGTRLIPIELIDVAGLVPGAHEGKGMGNQFLDDLRQASVLIQIVDASGKTDLEGNASSDSPPEKEVEFLEDEIHHWISSILMRNWSRTSRSVEAGEKLEDFLSDRLAGLQITLGQITTALRQTELPASVHSWNDEHALSLAKNIQKVGKPIIIAANKADISSDANLDVLKSLGGIPTASDLELALRNAHNSGVLRYSLGDSTFDIIAADKLNNQQTAALRKISDYLDKFNSTGVQKCIEEAVFNKLDLITAYPVEDETHYADSQGKVLPDCYLLPRHSTALDLAYKVHTDIGGGFIRAIDCKTKMVIGKDSELKDGDVIKIVSQKS